MGEQRDAGTADLVGARAHARGQAAAATATLRTVPSRAATSLPDAVAADAVVWDELVPGGGYASRVLPRGAVLRITDTAGDACVQLLVHNASATAERLNVMDTVKVQWQAYLGAGALLLSDMGRSLMTIVADASGQHDCLCGGSNRSTNARKYGNGDASGPAPNARDLLCLAAAKHGLGRADVPTSLNLFKRVTVEADGTLTYSADARPGAYVELRADMPVLVLLANTPHVLDSRSEYRVTPARITAWRAPMPGIGGWEADTPERQRAYENTDELLLTTGS